MTIIIIITPMITMPSVDPTSEASCADGVGWTICIESEAALKLCVVTFDRSKLAEANAKISVMNISVIPKTCAVFMFIMSIVSCSSVAFQTCMKSVDFQN